MGVPMGTLRSSRPSIRYPEDQTVVSVGPYIFQTEPQLAASLRASSGETASPPTIAFSLRSPVHPASSKSCHVVGVACINVAPELLRRLLSSLPSKVASRLAITRRAPAIRGRNMSGTDRSNEMVVIESRTSLSLIPGSSRIEQRRFARLRCSSCTPFGLPVEPEV